MKKIYRAIVLSAIFLGLVSCDFDTKSYQEIPADEAYKSLQDVQNGMNGAYYAIGYYYFLGNYATAYGDFCAGVSEGNSSSGHMYYQSAWIVTDTDSELSYIWSYGYKIIDRTTRTIKGAKEVLANTALHLTEDDIATIKLYMGQCYAMKALAYHYLVNLFAYPYQAGAGNLGLPLVKDEPIPEFTNISRATVGETYEQIKSDIDNAETYLAEGAAVVGEPNAFYMGSMAAQALKARIYMSLGEYETAKEAAKLAIALKGKGDGRGADATPSDATYLSMWTSLAITEEDLFTIAKSESDNLSANALNTLYGSYRAILSNNTWALFDDADIRAELLSRTSIGKYEGLSTSAATSNIPVLRKSEMSLIIAEVEARAGNIAEAQDYLFYTAKRNKNITSASELPDNTADLLKFISEERIREFAGEGHRFYDARRMGEVIEMAGFMPFDIAKFVFPIPSAEINAGFCTQQNDGWEAGLPTRG